MNDGTDDEQRNGDQVNGTDDSMMDSQAHDQNGIASEAEVDGDAEFGTYNKTKQTSQKMIVYTSRVGLIHKFAS